MKKRKRRSFIKLEETMTYEELKEFCEKIANEYATLPVDYARSYFMVKYDITANCFYRILETAIVLNWVSIDTVDEMEEKALSTQRNHYASAASSTRRHYHEMRIKRHENFLNNL